jgi:hypothetical protein
MSGRQRRRESSPCAPVTTAGRDVRQVGDVPGAVESWDWRHRVASEEGPKHATTRHVLLTLSLHMGKHGDHAFPSQEHLAKRTGMSVRSVRTHLKIAEDAGWIIRVPRRPTGSPWRHHQYVAALPAALANRRAPRASESQIRAEDPAPSRSKMLQPARVHRQANDAGRPANDDNPPGTSFRVTRNQLPINSSSNTPFNRSDNGARDGSEEPVALISLKPKAPVQDDSPDQRVQRLEKMIAGMPGADDETLTRCVRGSSLEEVQRARRRASCDQVGTQ